MSKKSDQFVPYFLVNFNLNKKLDEKSEDFAFHQNSNMNDSLTEIDHLTMSDFFFSSNRNKSLCDVTT